MTFTELVTEIMDRLNLSSTTAQTRIGRAINRKYRLVTSSIGLQLSRRDVLQQDVTPGVSQVTFNDVEKVISVQDRSSSPYRILEEVTLDELHNQLPYVDSDSPTRWAAHSHTSNTVTIEINRTPQTDFTLYADVHLALFDLSGTNEPAFPESFHDILIEGVLADELRKMEKPALAQIAKSEFDRISSDLRLWIAKNNALDIYQGKTSSASRAGSGGASGSGTINGANSWTQTGLITFDRDPLAPFVVTASSAVVTNLDADKLDGFHESSFAKLADNETVTGTYTFSNGVNFDGAVDFDAAIDASGATSLILPQAAVPAQTAEGSVFWDTNDDLLTVGTGAARKVMTDLDSTQTLTNKTLTSPSIATPTITGLTTLTGGQIAFPAVQSSSAGVNTLDDYEEGTWTPAWGGSGGQSGQTYTTQVGRYIKIGKQVWFHGDIFLSALGTITGTLRLTGLPFTSHNVNTARSALSIGYFNSLGTSVVFIGGHVVTNATYIDMYHTTAAAASVTQSAQALLGATTEILFSGFFEASA